MSTSDKARLGLLLALQQMGVTPETAYDFLRGAFLKGGMTHLEAHAELGEYVRVANANTESERKRGS